MNHKQINHEPDDWGDRAVRWLRAYYGDRSMNVVERDLDEPHSVIASWWAGGRPSRKKLQKLARKFERESFSQFVFGFASRGEVEALVGQIKENILVLEDYRDRAA